MPVIQCFRSVFLEIFGENIRNGAVRKKRVSKAWFQERCWNSFIKLLFSHDPCVRTQTQISVYAE